MRQRKVTIRIDAKLFKEATAILGERGVDLEAYLGLHVRALARSKQLLTLRDKFTFGKYGGELVENVVRGDPRYMSWALANVTWTRFGPDVMALADELDGGIEP